MTSSNSGTSDELVVMSFPITAGEVCTFAITGADAAFLELASSTPATSNTVRLASNAILNYESKTSYSFTITPTDLSGNVGTPQSCTFTVTDVDEVPNANPFTNVSNAPRARSIPRMSARSRALAASISVPVTFSGTGQYRKNGGSWSSAATTARTATRSRFRLPLLQAEQPASPERSPSAIPLSAGPTPSRRNRRSPRSSVGRTSAIRGSPPMARRWARISTGRELRPSPQLIGNLTDISGKNNTIAAAANDLTRPTWANVANGMLKFDGNDLLKSIGGFFAKGSTT
jgi:hypothetical protein